MINTLSLVSLDDLPRARQQETGPGVDHDTLKAAFYLWKKAYTSGSGLKIFPNINKENRTGKHLEKKRIFIQFIYFHFHKNIEN